MLKEDTLKNSTVPTKTKPPHRPVWLMPAVIVGVIAAILAVIALVINNRDDAFEPQVTGAPRAEVDVTSIDHGAVHFEQPVESVFRVRNIGDQPLVILGEPRVQLMEGC